MAMNHLESLETKFQRKPDFAKLYQDQIDEHTALGHAHQLSMEERKSNNDINCILHDGVLNISKPGKVCIVIDLSAKFHNTLLNNNLLPGVDFLNNLISVLAI